MGNQKILLFKRVKMITISDIKRQFYNGALFTSKYQIFITPPLSVNTNNITRTLTVLAKSASIPEHKIGASEIKLKGRPVTVRQQLEFGNSYNITVYEKSDMLIRKTLDKWIDISDSLYDSGDSSYCNGSIRIYQLDGEGNYVYGIEFYDVFLTSIGSVSYDSSSSGEVITYDLSFSYSGWDYIE